MGEPRYVVTELSSTPSGYKRYGVIDTKDDRLVSRPYFSEYSAECNAKDRNEVAQDD